MRTTMRQSPTRYRHSGVASGPLRGLLSGAPSPRGSSIAPSRSRRNCVMRRGSEGDDMNAFVARVEAIEGGIEFERRSHAELDEFAVFLLQVARRALVAENVYESLLFERANMAFQCGKRCKRARYLSTRDVSEGEWSPRPRLRAMLRSRPNIRLRGGSSGCHSVEVVADSSIARQWIDVRVRAADLRAREGAMSGYHVRAYREAGAPQDPEQFPALRRLVPARARGLRVASNIAFAGLALRGLSR